MIRRLGEDDLMRRFVVASLMHSCMRKLTDHEIVTIASWNEYIREMMLSFYPVDKCKRLLNEVIVEDYDSVTTRTKFNSKGRRHGEEVTKFKKTGITIVAQYKNGYAHGDAINYRQDGTVISKTKYINSRIVEYMVYNTSGQLVRHKSFKIKKGRSVFDEGFEIYDGQERVVIKMVDDVVKSASYSSDGKLIDSSIEYIGHRPYLMKKMYHRLGDKLPQKLPEDVSYCFTREEYNEDGTIYKIMNFIDETKGVQILHENDAYDVWNFKTNNDQSWISNMHTLYSDIREPKFIDIVRQGTTLTFHGEYKLHYPCGQLRVIGVYDNGVLHGDIKFFYPNGILWQVRTYEQGVLLSIETYNMVGVLYSRSKRENNLTNTTMYYKSGKVYATYSQLITPGDNPLHGFSYSYYESGTVRTITRYNNGVRDGCAYSFNEFGDVVCCAIYQNGLVRKLVHEYVDGHPNVICEFDESGELQGLSYETRKDNHIEQFSYSPSRGRKFAHMMEIDQTRYALFMNSDKKDILLSISRGGEHKFAFKLVSGLFVGKSADGKRVAIINGSIKYLPN